MKYFVLALTMAFGMVSYANAKTNKNIAIIDPSTICKPEYPKNSIINAEEGLVVLSLLVNIDGSVLDSKVERSSGFRGLDRAAQKSLTSCKFKPTSKAEWQTIKYKWELE